MRILYCLAGFAALGACSVIGPSNADSSAQRADWLNKARVSYDDTFRDLPFDTGTIYVVANEHGDLHTYSLTPCGVNRICGPNGRAGRVERTPDYFVVTGAYRDRTFYLSPGGDGYLNWRGENRDLAWN